MFTIDALWKNAKLAPLQKAHEANQMDRRLVVVINAASDVNIAETEALHGWLERQDYRSIPNEWETKDLDTLQVVHISQLSIEVLRRNPFGSSPAPLTPNSWLNQLPQEHFDAILLAQELGEIARTPTNREIKDEIKPALEDDNLSAFWSEMVEGVRFANSGAAAKNPRQKEILARWKQAETRRHYDPTEPMNVAVTTQQARNSASGKVRAYAWYDGGERKWNWRHMQLRTWIAQRIDTAAGLRQLAADVFGQSYRIDLGGTIENAAHALVKEAENCDMLSVLATLVEFELQPAAPSPFNQAGQQVYGQQVNVNTGGGVCISGDFIGRDKLVGNNVAGNRGVAIGGNINQTVIITGDNNK